METSLSFKDRAKQALYFSAGIGQGIVDTVKGVAKLAVFPYVKGYEGLKQGVDFIAHPQQKAEIAYQQAKQDYHNLQKLWNNPQEEIAKKKSQLSNTVQHEWNEFKKPYESSDPNVRAKAWGETAFTALSVLDGAAELKGLMVAEKEAALLSKVASIEEAGLKALGKAEGKIIPSVVEEANALKKIEDTSLLTENVVIKIKAPDQGALRAEKVSKFWQRASLKETTENLIGKEAQWVPSPNGQKMVAVNSKTGIKIAYDLKGKYFTVLKGLEDDFIYLGRNGEVIPNNAFLIQENKSISIGLSKDLRKGLSHFLNTDGVLPWK